MGQGAGAHARNAPFQVHPNKVPIVYSPLYNIGFWKIENLHPFDSKKYEKIYNSLVNERKELTPEDFYEPFKISNEELLKVHTQQYLDSLSSSWNVAKIIEVPPVAMLPNFLVQTKAIDPMRYATGGSLVAANLALKYGWSINLAGGYHHASAEEGGGFCVFADISLCTLFVHQQRPDIKSIMIIDLDAHQGNGHETDKVNGVFAGLDVFIFDIFNGGIYPGDQYAAQGIDRAIRLRHHTQDRAYLKLLREELTNALDHHKPQFIIYNAGTDCLIGDPLGVLDITQDGIRERDDIVFDLAFQRSIPITMLLSGGYQKNNAAVIASSISHLNQKFGLFAAARARNFPPEAREPEL